jgi:ATP-dependent DNA ligase
LFGLLPEFVDVVHNPHLPKAAPICAEAPRGKKRPVLDLGLTFRNRFSRHENLAHHPRRQREVIESPEWVYELKLDGFRGLADTINGRMLSKNLNSLKRFQHLLDGLPLACVFDSEICALDQEGKPDFNALLFGRGKPVYIVFDLLFYEGQDVRNMPLKERRGILDHLAQRYGLPEVGVVFPLWQIAVSGRLFS